MKQLERAFVLLNMELGSEREVVSKLRAIQNVKEVHTVYGVYDIAALLEGESLEKVKEIVTSIRNVKRISSTLTMLVVQNT